MNAFGWQGAPSENGADLQKRGQYVTVAAEKTAALAKRGINFSSQKFASKSPLSAADRTRAVLRQHSVGGLTQDEIKLRVAAQLAAIKANRMLAKAVA